MPKQVGVYVLVGEDKAKNEARNKARDKVLELAGRELDEAVADIVMAQPGRGPEYRTARVFPTPAYSADANAIRQVEDQMGELGLGYEYSFELLRLAGYNFSSRESAAIGVWNGCIAPLQRKCHAALLAVLDDLETDK